MADEKSVGILVAPSRKRSGREISVKIAVRYQSRGGNTKAVAEVIANSLGVKAEPVSSVIADRVDVLFIGGGVYMGKMDESLYRFLAELNSDNVGQIVCFSTTGSMASTINQIKQFAIQKGIIVNKNELLLKMLLQGHSALGLVGGKLTDKQIEKIELFTNNVLISTEITSTSIL